MNKILVSLLLLVSMYSYAMEDMNYVAKCDDTQLIFKTLSSEYGETMVLAGNGPEGSSGVMSLWVNNTTKTWTILLTEKEKTCVIGGGRNITLRGEKKNSV